MSFWDQFGPDPRQKKPRRQVEEGPDEERPVGRAPPRPGETGDRNPRQDALRTPVVNEWRTRVVLKASWRGIEFELDTYTLPVGRKSFVHEYAQSSGIFVEDNGRETRYHRLTGFVTGDDYDLKRDALIRALDAEGPGDLIHPYFGLRRCRVLPGCVVTESTTEWRRAKFEMSFVDVDEGKFPREVTDYPSVVVDKGLKLVATTKTIATSNYDALKIKKPLAYLGAFTEFANETLPEHLLTFLGMALGSDVGTFLLTVFDVQLLVQALKSWPATPRGSSTEEDVATATLSTWQRTEVENRAAVLVATTDYPSYDAAVTQATTVFDQIIRDEDETTDGATYNLLVDLRVSLMKAVYALATILPRERDLEVVAPTPAIVLAWGLYEDPLRDQEIVARNHVEHPSFCAGTLKVLSR